MSCAECGSFGGLTFKATRAHHRAFISPRLGFFSPHYIRRTLNTLLPTGKKTHSFAAPLCRFTCGFQRVTQLFCITWTLIYVKLAPAAPRRRRTLLRMKNTHTHTRRERKRIRRHCWNSQINIHADLKISCMRIYINKYVRHPRLCKHRECGL